MSNLDLLARVSNFVQIAAIFLVFIGGSLQLSKFAIDKRINYLKSQIEIQREKEHTNKISELQNRIVSLKDKVIDRMVPIEKYDEVISILKKSSGSEVSFHITSNDRESVAYARQFEDLFKKAGWNVKAFKFSVISGPFRGIGLKVKNPNNRPVSLASIEQAFLNVLALNVKGAINTSLNENEVEIIVGAQ
jgi:hypothetical protein